MIIDKYKKVLNQSINTTKLKLNRIIGELEIKDLDFSHKKVIFIYLKTLVLRHPQEQFKYLWCQWNRKNNLAKIILVY